jgi:signal transduction histidine kinase
MNGVLGMIDLVLETELHPTQFADLEIAKTSAESLMIIINDILDFSKIEAGRLILDPRAFSPREMISAVISMLAVQAQAKRIELACHIDPEIPDLIVTDPDRLRRVLVNLLGNGIKFTQHGRVVLRASVESTTETDTTLHFSVSDTGIGIPQEHQKRIFEPFIQGDGSTTRRFGGTGLGLAISSQLVQMLGGEISVESDPGRGSTFHFTAVVERVTDQGIIRNLCAIVGYSNSDGCR